MPNDYFQFKEFIIHQGNSAMKVTTDSCLFGAWCSSEIYNDSKISSDGEKKKLLDIGAGTGLLSLMIAQKNKLDITAVEIEKGAALQARENIAASPFAKNIMIEEADILHHSGTGYNHIVSNPPFYENEWMSPARERNIAHHSQLLKWTDLFPVIGNKLHTDGTAFLLLPSSRMQLANDLLEDAGLYISKEILVMQTEGRSPFRRMLKISRRKSPPVVNELAVRDLSGAYTEAFQFYLKDYYLYL